MCLVFFYDFCMKLSRGKKNDGNCISVGTILMLDWFLFDWLSKMSFIGLKKNKVEYYFPYNRKLFYFYRHMGLFSLSTMCDHAYRLFFVLLLEKILSDKTCLHHFYLKLHFFIPVVRRYTKSNKFTICLQTLKKNWWQADILSWMPQMLVNHHFVMSVSWGWKIKMISYPPVADV